MKFGKETAEKYVKFDVDIDNNEYDMLKNYGLEQIKNDDQALINYAVNKILRAEVEREEKKGKKSKK